MAAPTFRMTTRAMACEFAVILNQEGREFADAASLALERVHALEQVMTVYADDSPLSAANREGTLSPVPDDLTRVLTAALDLYRETGGRFDPTTGPLIALWRACREEARVPSQSEIEAALEVTGADKVSLTEAELRLDRDVQLNLGAIGKGFALDEAAVVLQEHGAGDFLLHGGRSSILATGRHSGHDGWPVGIGNPIFTKQRLGVIELRDEALGTSGSNIQYFRHAGQRYGHILDPQTGWPSTGVASVTVLAPQGTAADALSTAFFVGGVEFAQSWCDNHPEISAILVPFPETGRLIEPVLVNLPADRVRWSGEQVRPR